MALMSYPTKQAKGYENLSNNIADLKRMLP
jgi:hypothetical protein